jgi:hypothetical protein
VKRLLLLLALILTPASAPAESWIFLPSTHTHDDQGRRVTQYESPVKSYYPQRFHYWLGGQDWYVPADVIPYRPSDYYHYHYWPYYWPYY